MGGSHAEGVLTSRSAYQLAQRKGLDCATIEGIYRVLFGGSSERPHSSCAWGRF